MSTSNANQSLKYMLGEKEINLNKARGETGSTSHWRKHCQKCNSPNVYGFSRVVGYYSIIENWNEGKQAEHQDRQKGNYQIKDVRT